jgi:hypothetical protein
LIGSVTISSAQGLEWGKPRDTVIRSYKDNTIKIETSLGPKIAVINPDTDEITYRKARLRRITLLNDRPVYKGNEARAAKVPFRNWNRMMERRLRQELKESWNYFNEIELVVDEAGKVAYLDVKFWDTRLDAQRTRMDENKRKELTERISHKLTALRFKPAKKDGYAVPYHLTFD